MPGCAKSEIDCKGTGNVTMPPMPIGEIGQMAMITDPEGAMLSLLQAN